MPPACPLPPPKQQQKKRVQCPGVVRDLATPLQRSLSPPPQRGEPGNEARLDVRQRKINKAQGRGGAQGGRAIPRLMLDEFA